YCCHKIDKRISELLKKNTKKRLRKRQLQAKAEAEGDFSHLKKKKSAQTLVINDHRQPTLPKVDNLLPSHPLSQKPTLPEPVRKNFPPNGQNSAGFQGLQISRSNTPNHPPHGQNSAGLQGLQINRSDTNNNNHLPYKNNAKVSYKLPGPGYPQHPQRPQLYTRKTPAPGIIPQRGYNNLAAMSEPIPQIHVTRSEPTSQIHAAISEPIPKIYVGRSEHIPQVDAAISEPIPKIYVARSEPIPQINVAKSEPIPQINVTMSDPVPQVNVAMSEPIPLVPQSIPQAYATKFKPVYQASITTSQSIPSIELQSTSQQQTKSVGASYDCVDIIDNYHSYSESVDVERRHENNFASSSQSHQLPNQTALQVEQSMYDYTQQGSSKVIEEEYFYAQ
ncbi:2123_t:CDS:2, partial [Acaulospora morrowiae]